MRPDNIRDLRTPVPRADARTPSPSPTRMKSPQGPTWRVDVNHTSTRPRRAQTQARTSSANTSCYSTARMRPAAQSPLGRHLRIPPSAGDLQRWTTPNCPGHSSRLIRCRHPPLARQEPAAAPLTRRHSNRASPRFDAMENRRRIGALPWTCSLPRGSRGAPQSSSGCT
jgi:hypothetical protein